MYLSKLSSSRLPVTCSWSTYLNVELLYAIEVSLEDKIGAGSVGRPKRKS